MLTCSKTYSDIPFAHRQHRHRGSCAFLHGHNWSITITFGCHEPDENGFVVDFGRLKYIRSWLDEHLDHACVFNADDPLRERLTAVGGPEVWKVYLVDQCSCEGLARHLFGVFDPMVRASTGGRAFVVAVSVAEDAKNTAAFSLENRGDYGNASPSSATSFLGDEAR